MPTRSQKPRMQFDLMVSYGLAALELASKNATTLGSRVPDAVPAQLGADLAQLGAAVPGALGARLQAKAATAAKSAATLRGHALVKAVRSAVVRNGATAEIRSAYGVGGPFSQHHADEVRAAIAVIVARAEQVPDEATSFGVLPADVAALRAAHAAIGTAESATHEVHAVAKLSTKERNDIARRVRAATHRIATAGVIAFASDAAAREPFEALMRARQSQPPKPAAPDKAA